MCECGNRGRQGGVDRLTRLGFFCLLSLFLFSYRTKCLQSMFRPGGELVCSAEKPGRRCFSLGLTVIVVKTAQKKEGKGETTWGDNKKKKVL